MCKEARCQNEGCGKKTWCVSISACSWISVTWYDMELTLVSALHCRWGCGQHIEVSLHES